MTLKIATWNVNSLRSRLAHVHRFAQEHQPDILCLQEIKCANGQFPLAAVQEMGFPHVLVNGQRAYHGVAILSRRPLRLLATHDYTGAGEARHQVVAIEGTGDTPVLLHNFYVPAGGDVPDPETNPKFREKLDYLSAMARRFGGKDRAKDWERAPRMILVGDLNVAPLETDVWSHKQLLKVVSHTPVEVAHLTEVQKSQDWVDVMRQHVPPEERLYTWWSYRARDWRKSNRGRRLDHIWVTPALKDAVPEMRVLDETRDWERPSDHVPVLATFRL